MGLPIAGLQDQGFKIKLHLQMPPLGYLSLTNLYYSIN